ncbi:MAG: hypothetical protein NTX52_12870, partial [Planctomycetota bacterium]|nr:hypothetical protein [Planctomycetota bacterium]
MTYELIISRSEPIPITGVFEGKSNAINSFFVETICFTRAHVVRYQLKFLLGNYRGNKKMAEKMPV